MNGQSHAQTSSSDAGEEEKMGLRAERLSLGQTANTLAENKLSSDDLRLQMDELIKKTGQDQSVKFDLKKSQEYFGQILTNGGHEKYLPGLTNRVHFIDQQQATGNSLSELFEMSR